MQTTTVDWSHELVEQLDYYWKHMLRPRLDGLTDDEFFWEPVAGCWSVRRDAGGRWVPDWKWPEPSPPPVTTIAWRLAHLGPLLLGLRSGNHFGDGTLTIENADWAGSAAEAIATLERYYRAWIDGVRGLGGEGLGRECGPSEGPFAKYPMATLVLHVSREVFHHGAEIALLRDLYRAGAGRLSSTP